MQAIITRIALYLIGAVLITGAVTGAYYAWKRGVEKQVELRMAVEQLQEAAAGLKRANEELLATLEIARDVQSKIEKDRKDWEDRMGGILSGIDGAEDRESSPVLKDTIRELAR